MANELLAWLLQQTLAASVAIALVLLLRGALRRVSGPRVAYLLWLAVPAASLAVLLPSPAIDLVDGTVAAGAAMAAPHVTVGWARVLHPVAVPSQVPQGLADLLATVWLLGFLVSVRRAWHAQRHVRRALGELARRDDGAYSSSSALGPLVIGLWPARIVLPDDFESRFAEAERRLVIAHERAHVRRGDVPANLLATAFHCVHWFNPLVHAAAGRLRVDQELACDATVLARHPRSRRAYADAMLKTQLTAPALPVGCQWQSGQLLKERIRMLRTPQPGGPRRAGGIIAVALVVLATSHAAWSVQARTVQAPELRGWVDRDGVAFADVSIPARLAVEVTAFSLSMGARQGDSRTTLNGRKPLRLDALDPGAPWTLEVRGRGSLGAPLADWTLVRRGSLIGHGTVEIPHSGSRALDLSMVADSAGRVPTVVFSRMPADAVVEVNRSPGHGRPMGRDPDGIYREAESVRAYGDGFNADGGRAVLLVEVGADGRVGEVTVESAQPAGSLDAAAARDLVARNVYVPRQVDGHPQPSRIRVPVDYWRESLATVGPVRVGRVPAASVVSAPDARVSHTPAPAYPPEALANRVAGFVLLHLRVGPDGQVRQARAVASRPKGVFDAATTGAARGWTLSPEIEDGKPVEAWMQVPVTFDPDGWDGRAGALQ